MTVEEATKVRIIDSRIILPLEERGGVIRQAITASQQRQEATEDLLPLAQVIGDNYSSFSDN